MLDNRSQTEIIFLRHELCFCLYTKRPVNWLEVTSTLSLAVSNVSVIAYFQNCQNMIDIIDDRYLWSRISRIVPPDCSWGGCPGRTGRRAACRRGETTGASSAETHFRACTPEIKYWYIFGLSRLDRFFKKKLWNMFK
jgi:hypothetical protein